MSDFVNYNKRSFALPPGCKDLIDVLHPQGLEWLRVHLDPDLSRAIVRGGSVKGRLSEIGKYVQMAFGSRALAFMLGISSPDERLTVNVSRMSPETMWASVVVQEHTPQEAAVRDFFARHNLQLPRESRDSSIPWPLYPQAPVHLICRISSMPDPIILSRLATELFSQVCGLSDESELCYDHHELVNAA